MYTHNSINPEARKKPSRNTDNLLKNTFYDRVLKTNEVLSLFSIVEMKYSTITTISDDFQTSKHVTTRCDAGQGSEEALIFGPGYSNAAIAAPFKTGKKGAGTYRLTLLVGFYVPFPGITPDYNNPDDTMDFVEFKPKGR